MNDASLPYFLIPILGMISFIAGRCFMRFLFRLSSRWHQQQLAEQARQQRIQAYFRDVREPYSLDELDRMIRPYRPGPATSDTSTGPKGH